MSPSAEHQMQANHLLLHRKHPKCQRQHPLSTQNQNFILYLRRPLLQAQVANP